MKKLTVGLGTGLAAGLLAAAAVMNVGAAANGQTAAITEERAKEIAMDHAGVDGEDISYITVKTDYERGQKVYDVEFYTKDYREYDYEIGAADGVVVSCDYDAETSFWRNLSEKDRTVSVTEEKAKEIALDHAGKKAADVTFVKVKLDYDDGAAFYDVEFYAGDQEEYDYEISAWTGEIVGWDYDMESFRAGQSENRTEKTSGSGSGAGQVSVTEAEAKAAALEAAGLKESQVRGLRIHTDRDDGRTVYEGKFFYNDLEYEFEVDAASGRVTDWDVESIYD